MTTNIVISRFGYELKGRTDSTCNYCDNSAGYCVEKRGELNQLLMAEIHAADLVCEIHLDKHYNDFEVATIRHCEPLERAKQGNGPIA